MEKHYERRHPGIRFSLPVDPVYSVTEILQSEVKELKERVNKTERMIHKGTDEQSTVNISMVCNFIQ